MDKFSYLVKKRNGALWVFEKARQKLLSVLKEIEVARLESAKNITDHQRQIAEEGKCIAFLDEQHKQNTETINKIRAIM